MNQELGERSFSSPPDIPSVGLAVTPSAQVLIRQNRKLISSQPGPSSFEEACCPFETPSALCADFNHLFTCRYKFQSGQVGACTQHGAGGGGGTVHRERQLRGYMGAAAVELQGSGKQRCETGVSSLPRASKAEHLNRGLEQQHLTVVVAGHLRGVVPSGGSAREAIHASLPLLEVAGSPWCYCLGRHLPSCLHVIFLCVLRRYFLFSQRRCLLDEGSP